MAQRPSGHTPPTTLPQLEPSMEPPLAGSVDSGHSPLVSLLVGTFQLPTKLPFISLLIRHDKYSLLSGCFQNHKSLLKLAKHVTHINIISTYTEDGIR